MTRLNTRHAFGITFASSSPFSSLSWHAAFVPSGRAREHEYTIMPIQIIAWLLVVIVFWYPFLMSLTPLYPSSSSLLFHLGIPKFILSMLENKVVIALAYLDIDLRNIARRLTVTMKWRENPFFVTTLVMRLNMQIF